MEMIDLEALCVIAEAGSLSAAATRLGCSQPALSRRVQRMERDLGARLLARSGRGTALTPAGEQVLGFARDTLGGYERLRAALGDGAQALRGTVRIVASTTTGDYVVPELVARFTDRYPHVRTEVLLADSAAVPGTLLEHRADVGFAGRKNPDRRLVHVPIAADEVVLAVPADHPLAGTCEIPLSALAGERLIWREDGSGTQRTFMEALAAAGLELPEGSSTVSLGSTQAIVSAVAAGLGIGVASHRAVRHHDGVAAVRLEGLPVTRDLWLVYEQRPHRASHHEAFVTFVAATADRQGDRAR